MKVGCGRPMGPGVPKKKKIEREGKEEEEEKKMKLSKQNMFCIIHTNL